MYEAYIILLGMAIVSNSILLIVYYRHSQRNSTTLSLFLLLLLVNIWFIPKFITNAFHPTGAGFETLSRIAALGYIFVPPVLLVFTLTFGTYRKIFTNMFFWFFILIPPLFFLYLSWTSNLIGVHEFSTAKMYPWGYETPTGLYWPHYLVWYNFMSLLAAGVLVKYYHSMIDQTKKKQALYFIYAILIPLVINMIAVGILPIFNIFIFPIGLIFMDVVTIVGISLIYRYRWFEVSPLIILSSIDQLILTVDKNGRVRQANSFAEKLLRRNTVQLAGMPLEKVLFIRHKDKKKTNCTSQLLHLVLSKGKSMTFESFSVLIHKKQELTDMFSISPIYSDNAIVGANIYLRDTRKEKVKEKQKDDYFSMLSHELKSPMTSIKAYNQLLQARLGNSSEENKKIFTNIDNQLDRLTRLVNGFFELSKLNSGKVILQKEYFSIDDLVQRIVESVRITHKKREFRIHGNTNSMIYADRDKIEQILLNFITNAIKFSPENKEIVIHLAENKKNVTIGIQDYGKGIDPKFHKKIFERFFQVGPTSKQKIGLGLGLSITSTIVRAHAGKIWVDSRIGKGSTFYVSLPVNKA